MEQNQHGEQLQTARQHIENQHPFAEDVEGAEIAGGTDHRKTGADVVDGGGHGGEGGDDILSLDADEQDGQTEDQHIGGQVDIDGPDGLMVHGTALHLDPVDGPGMDVRADLPEGGFEEDEDAADLDAAAGGACAGADEHQQHKHRLGQGAPLVEIRRGEARGGDDGTHLEGSMGQRFKGGVGPQQRGENDAGGGQNDDEIPPYLLHPERLSELTEEEEIVGVEVDAEEDHENGDDPLQVGTVAGDGISLDAEAAGTGSAEAVGDGLKNGHPAQQQKDDLQHRQAEIDDIQDPGGAADLGHQLAHAGAGGFRLHQVELTAAGHRQHRQQEHQHAHAADPVGEAAPEQARIAHGLHIRQDGRARGGEAGHRFEHGVGEGGDLAGQDEGYRAEGRQNDPAQGGADTALLQIDGGVFGPFDGDKRSQDHTDCSHRKVCPALLLAVDQSHEEAGQHQRTFDAQDLAQDIDDHCSVHNLLLMPGCPGCR